MARIHAAARALLWYLREVTGEHEYDRYTEHQRRHHPGAPLLARREFERQRMDELDKNPNPRCC